MGSFSRKVYVSEVVTTENEERNAEVGTELIIYGESEAISIPLLEVGLAIYAGRAGDDPDAGIGI